MNRDIKDYLGSHRRSTHIKRYALKFDNKEELESIINLLDIKEDLVYTKMFVLTLDDFKYDDYNKVSEYVEYEVIGAGWFIHKEKVKIVNMIKLREISDRDKKNDYEYRESNLDIESGSIR